MAVPGAGVETVVFDLAHRNQIAAGLRVSMSTSGQDPTSRRIPSLIVVRTRDP
jgi:hypothetical protein